MVWSQSDFLKFMGLAFFLWDRPRAAQSVDSRRRVLAFRISAAAQDTPRSALSFFKKHARVRSLASVMLFDAKRADISEKKKQFPPPPRRGARGEIAQRVKSMPPSC